MTVPKKEMQQKCEEFGFGHSSYFCYFSNCKSNEECFRKTQNAWETHLIKFDLYPQDFEISAAEAHKVLWRMKIRNERGLKNV